MRIFILTRGYPAEDRIYNHGFVHSRAVEYRARGHDVHVFWLKPRGDLLRYAYEGIEVNVGGPEACLSAIAAFAPDAVAAHAPADDFWPVLSRLPESLPVNGWIYGAEILPFYLTTENKNHDAARWEKARAVFERRIAFWRARVTDWPENLRLVFVSHYAAREAERAVGQPIPRWTVQPSGVDTRLFAAMPKPPGQRLRVLSIRPFSDWRYANDLSVEAILRLRSHPAFTHFAFHFVGDGRLFEEIMAPLAGLPNVTNDRHFLPQTAIAALHRDYGILLCPSRNDAQGVSRDQAMSSGLVPIVSRVGAVPEFVDETCGFLTEPESAQGIADAMAALAASPGRFATCSRAAAARIRATIAMPDVIAREIELLKN